MSDIKFVSSFILPSFPSKHVLHYFIFMIDSPFNDKCAEGIIGRSRSVFIMVLPSNFNGKNSLGELSDMRSTPLTGKWKREMKIIYFISKIYRLPPLLYQSRSLFPAQLNWWIVEMSCLCILTLIGIVSNYKFGSINPKNHMANLCDLGTKAINKIYFLISTFILH